MGPTNRTAAESRHLAAVSGLGCVVCRNLGLHDPAAHHEAITSPHHIVEGHKRLGHFFVLPLCHFHHQGGLGFHFIGRRSWEMRFGTQAELLRQTYELLGAEMPDEVKEWLDTVRTGNRLVP